MIPACTRCGNPDPDDLDLTQVTGACLNEDACRRRRDRRLALAAVTLAARAARETAGALGGAVRQARAGGATWADIGRAAGMSRQAAHERWGKL